jgi:hypothetical protein
MILKMKGQRVDIKNANISKLERVMNCLHYLKTNSTVVKKEMIKFVILLLDKKIKRLYEKEKVKFKQSEV